VDRGSGRLHTQILVCAMADSAQRGTATIASVRATPEPSLGLRDQNISLDAQLGNSP
jgi:hypothetical protein